MDSALITVGGVLAGTTLWLWVLRSYDRIEPESVRHLVQVAFIGGLMSVIVAAGVNEMARWLLDMRVNIFVDAARIDIGQLFVFCLFIGFNEEVCKAVATVFSSRRFGDLNEPVDAMIYAMTVALGFASFENVLYAFRFGNDVLLARFLWPVPAHMAYAALWGFGLAKARFAYPAHSRLLIMAPAVALAAVLHATANFLLFLQETMTAMISLFAIVVLAVLAHVRLQQLVAESPFLQPGECPSCRHMNAPDLLFCAACDEPMGDTEMFVTCPHGCTRVPAYVRTCPQCGTALGGGEQGAGAV